MLRAWDRAATEELPERALKAARLATVVQEVMVAREVTVVGEATPVRAATVATEGMPVMEPEGAVARVLARVARVLARAAAPE